jgi:hypothetical protein
MPRRNDLHRILIIGSGIDLFSDFVNLMERKGGAGGFACPESAGPEESA